MKRADHGIDRHVVLAVLASVLVVVVLRPIVPAQAADERKRSEHQADKTSTDKSSLQSQLQELRAKVARLEAALKQNHEGKKANTSSASRRGKRGQQDQQGSSGSNVAKSSGGKGMSKMSKKDGRGMGMMKKGMGMGKMEKGMGMGMGMGMMKKGMSMGMMGRMPSAGGMTMPSALPGFPGASHIYHIGETGFFLDHPQHITLTSEQQTALNQKKEKALLAKASVDRKIEEAEQQLWVLTSADKPDIAKIDAKVREIEGLRGDQRIAFIRAVGEAAQVLTGEQRKTLVGDASPKSKTSGAGDKATGEK